MELGIYIHIPFCIKKCSYCDFMNIPYDFALTVMSPGFAIEVAIVLSVIEISVVIWLFNKLKRF